MSDFGKKMAAIAVVAAIMFGVFACMSYFKSDIGEDGVKALQALAAGLAIVLANMARSILVVLLAVSLLGASTAEAGAGFGVGDWATLQDAYAQSQDAENARDAAESKFDGIYESKFGLIWVNSYIVPAPLTPEQYAERYDQWRRSVSHKAMLKKYRVQARKAER